MAQEAIRLGIDTGGTYTDAVLVDSEDHIIAAAKAVTTHHDLSLGIAGAVDAVMTGRDIPIDLVGLSTTLATNAVVEGKGGRVGLLMIGFGAEAASRGELTRALAGDPCNLIAGGHDAHGMERQPLDREALDAAVIELATRVDAFAITAAFAVRNPEHELAAAARVAELTHKPVTLSHALAHKLDGPKRAVTTVLNARLVPEIGRLLDAVEEILRGRGIKAPVMVVRGDGSLMRAQAVRHRPVETVLSGPAASVVGAAKLARLQDAIVSDVGGTTTDIALLHQGRPRIATEGANIAGFRTMVEAIELTTIGLGGDSAVTFDGRGVPVLGPERQIPLVLLAAEYPSIMATMERQLARYEPRRLDGAFASIAREPSTPLNRPQQRLFELLQAGPLSLEQIIEREHAETALERLVMRGVVKAVGFTPTDAAHVLGLQSNWDAAAGMMGARLLARRMRGAADMSAGKALAKEVLDAARQASALALAEAAALADGDRDRAWLHSEAVRRATNPNPSVGACLSVALRLDRPVIAVGGPTKLFYPDAARALQTELAVPEHYAVANAAGAVLGEVSRRLQVSILQTAEERYAFTWAGERHESDDAHALAARAQELLGETAAAHFQSAGGSEPEVTFDVRVKSAQIDIGREMIVGIDISALARGRPRLGA